MQPYFSLILPVYKVEEYLDKCMQSILEQDFTDFEIILVDDGSPDRCPQICDDYARKYSFVRVVHKPNGGLSSARNAGLQIASGQYIWFIDSDDWIESGALKLLYEKSAGFDVVKFNHFRVAESRETILSNAPAGVYEEKEQISALIRTAFCAGGKYVLSVWSHIYSRKMLEAQEISFVSEQEIGSEDYLFNLNVLPRAQRVLVIADALYNYEKRGGSVTQKYKATLADRYTRLYADLMDAYCKMGLQTACAGLIRRFYAWHLIVGTCLPHEYYSLTEEHSLKDARRNVRRFFKIPEFREALRKGDRINLPRQKKIQLYAMLLGFEPLFYYLYVVKPGKKT